MNHEDYKRNIKLGAFVIGGITIFLLAVFYLGSQNNYFNKTFTVSAIFKNVEGLKEGDNVWLSGVKIGTVRVVQIVSEGKVVIRLSLKDKQNEFIKQDATAFIGSDGLVGNKIVVIRPGVSVNIIEDQDTINSLSPTDTQELINIAKEIGTTTRSITLDLKLISSKINKGEGILGELLHEGPVSSDLRGAISALKAAGDNTKNATTELNKVMMQINNGNGLVTKLLKDTSYVTTFDHALVNVAQVSVDAKKMSGELQKITAKMNEGDNAIGVLLSDTAFAAKLQGTLTNTQLASAKLDQNMEAMQHSFPLKRYFKKQKKTQAKIAE